MENPITFLLVTIVLATVMVVVALQPWGRGGGRESFSTGQWINTYFAEVYVVTLPSRRKYISRVMATLNIEPVYIDAVLAKDLDRAALVQQEVITSDCTLSLPRIACHMSHTDAMMRFLHGGGATALIFEDDIAPLGDEGELAQLQKSMARFMANVPEDWDLVNFGRCWDFCATNLQIADNVYKSFRAFCRHAYAVTRDGAKIVLWGTLPMRGAKQSDETIADLASHGKLNMYVPDRAMFTQNRQNLGSTLDNKDIPQQECLRPL